MTETEFGKMDASGKVVTIHVIDLSKIKSPDPLAYGYGLVQGERGEPIERKKGLASEYIRGWKEGNKNYKAKLKKVL